LDTGSSQSLPTPSYAPPPPVAAAPPPPPPDDVVPPPAPPPPRGGGWSTIPSAEPSPSRSWNATSTAPPALPVTQQPLPPTPATESAPPKAGRAGWQQFQKAASKRR
jgi:hypothetical protein